MTYSCHIKLSIIISKHSQILKIMLGGIFMEYEVVNLDEKILVGASANTSNSSPDMSNVIRG